MWVLCLANIGWKEYCSLQLSLHAFLWMRRDMALHWSAARDVNERVPLETASRKPVENFA